MGYSGHDYYPTQTVIFWVAIMVIVAVSALRKFLTDRERQRTMRAAIERGQQVDPVLLGKIVASQPPCSYRGQLQIGGIITLSTGIGLCLMGMFLRTGSGFNPTLGPGILVSVIGIGILVAALTQPRSQDGSGPPDAGM